MASSLPACDYLLICGISKGMVKTEKCSSICWKLLSLKKSRIYIKWCLHWCTKITSTSASRISSFVSDHEEADKKLVALVDTLNSSGNTVLVRSPSGDINILMIFLLHQFKNKRMLTDNDTISSRKIIDMSSTNLTKLQRQALVGVHAFSGNDYVLCFFRKGKNKFWDVLAQHERFVQTFADLGLFGHVME